MSTRPPQVITRSYTAAPLPASVSIPLETYFNDLLPTLGVRTAIEFVENGWLQYMKTFRDFKILHNPSSFRAEINDEIKRVLDQPSNLLRPHSSATGSRRDPFSWDLSFERISPNKTEEELAAILEAYYNNPDGIEDATFKFTQEKDGRRYYRITRASLERYIQSINISIQYIQRALRLGTARQELEEQPTPDMET